MSLQFSFQLDTKEVLMDVDLSVLTRIKDEWRRKNNGKVMEATIKH